MTERNPFIFNRATTATLTPKQVKRVKSNNAYLFAILSNIVAYNGDLTFAKSHIAGYMNQATSGKLLFTDDQTNVNTNNLGSKLRFLLVELDSNPESRKTFCSSSFYLHLRSLFKGDCAYKNVWGDYKLTDISDAPKYVSKDNSALSNAINIYANDPEAEIGIDMAKVIDTIVTTDQYGNYILKPNEDLKASAQLYDAVAEQTRILKSTEGFRKYYKAQQLHREDEEERE